MKSVTRTKPHFITAISGFDRRASNATYNVEITLRMSQAASDASITDGQACAPSGTG
jgi:hypothetical protein